MRIVLTLTLALFCVSGVPPSYGQAPQARPLDIYVVDVEGGQATLVVSPSGQSMLVDAGWPGFEGRDPGRIEAAMKQAGVSRIDYFVATHYHTDHIGGVPALAARRDDLHIKSPNRNLVARLHLQVLALRAGVGVRLEEGVGTLARFDRRTVIDERLDRKFLGELRHAADVIGVIVRGDEIVDLRHARLLGRRGDAIRVTALEARPAGVHEQRLSRR